MWITYRTSHTDMMHTKTLRQDSDAHTEGWAQTQMPSTCTPFHTHTLPSTQLHKQQEALYSQWFGV